MLIPRKILNFDCFRCGVCCVKFQAPLDTKEVRQISAFLDCGPDEFVRNFTDRRWQGKEKLLVHKDGACCFLNRDTAGKINQCRIHEVRPAACRDWASGPEKRECRDGLFQLWNLTIDEKGALSGSDDQIAAFKSFLNSLDLLGSGGPNNPAVKIPNTHE